jgi:hypothetical protein
MSAQTIAEQLRSLQAQIAQIAENAKQLEDAILFFDIGCRLGEMQQQASNALQIAEGAAQAEIAA